MVQDRKIDVDKREQLIINSDIGSYSSVPNRRAGPNKRAGGNILKKH